MRGTTTERLLSSTFAVMMWGVVGDGCRPLQGPVGLQWIASMVMSMPHILIVEDEDDIRTFLVRAMGRLAPQAEVLAARNGKEALGLFQKQICDLILSDQRMPLMTGIELLQAVRAIATDVPVVIFSADVTAETPALQAGATAFFHKPITVPQLRQILSLWLRCCD